MKSMLRGVLILGLSLVLIGGATGEDKKPQKKEEKRALDLPFPDLEKLFEQLGGGLSEEQLKEFRERMKETQELLQQLQRGQGGFGFQMLPGLGGRVRPQTSIQEGRLGATLRTPSAAMIDQLDLPKEQGLILEEVGANSPASKAGLKANDILLEVDGKAVPNKRAEFDKVLAEVKADKAVDVVVMRKGKKETVKGLKLPEAKAMRVQPRPGPGLFPRLPGGLGGGIQGGSTTVTRKDDEFTAKHKGDGATVTVKGKVNQGKAEPSEIAVEVDGKTTTYASVDKVPAEHQEVVKKLLALSAGKGKALGGDDF